MSVNGGEYHFKFPEIKQCASKTVMTATLLAAKFTSYTIL
jgi:hypothetical protein